MICQFFFIVVFILQKKINLIFKFLHVFVWFAICEEYASVPSDHVHEYQTLDTKF